MKTALHKLNDFPDLFKKDRGGYDSTAKYLHSRLVNSRSSSKHLEINAYTVVPAYETRPPASYCDALVYVDEWHSRSSAGLQAAEGKF